MSKTIVVAYRANAVPLSNPIYAIQVLDDGISSQEWLDWMKKDTGITDLKLCHTAWLETWTAREPKEKGWHDKYKQEISE
jgi:hypothetical protein